MIKDKAKWREMTLDDVCAQITDGAHLSPASVDQGFPMASVKDLTPYGITIHTCRHISEKDFEKLIRMGCQPQIGDVLISKDGASALDTVCIVKERVNVVLLSSVAILRSDPAKIFPAYLRYYLDSKTTREYMKAAFTTGAAIPRVVLKDFKKVKIKLPDLSIQYHIASILSAYDDLIENNIRRIKILEEMAQRIYKEWFVDFRFPGHEKVKFVDSELGRIPSGWGVVQSSKAIHYNPAIKMGKGESKPFVSMAGLCGNSMVVTPIEWRDGNSGSKFQNGDTLFARITPCLENGKTGFVNFLPTKDSVATGSTEFIVMRSASLCPEFVYCLARSDAFRDNAIKSMAGASGRQRVRNECFDNYCIAQPPDLLINSFRDIVSPMFSIIHTLSLKNTNLRLTRDLLLPKLISGEIDVSEMPDQMEAAAA